MRCRSRLWDFDDNSDELDLMEIEKEQHEAMQYLAHFFWDRRVSEKKSGRSKKSRKAAGGSHETV